MKKRFKPQLFIASLVAFIISATKSIFAQADIIGKIEEPAGVKEYNALATGGIGIVIFASRLIKVSSIIAGIWVMINFIQAGWLYITSAGDSGAHTKVSSKMTMSVIGLMIIVGSYTMAALIGLLIFGDASYILNPKFEGI